MSTPVRRMTHYSGLATGQGPSTFSTSPLWAPYGPYSMNRKQFQGQFGALDFHGYSGEHADASSEMMGTLKGYAQSIMDHKTMGVPSWILATGAFLAYRSGLLNRILPMPIRANRWDAMTSVPGVASQMAKMRWAIAAGDEAGIKSSQKFFAKLAKMPMTKWRGRHSLKAYGPYGSSKKSSKKPEGFVAAIVDAITPDVELSVKKSKKKSTKRKPALSSRGRKIVSVSAKTEKKRLTKSARSATALKRRAMKLGQKYGLKEGWKIAKSELAYADARGNPKRRRKNGTKKGQTRKTARRAYMRNRR
jgi:hypothetical protein